MNAYKDFIISPIGERYDNVKQFDDKELILNTEIYNHQFVNRKAKVIATPLLFQSPVKVGDEVVVHHNVFRRWHNVKGVEKNSRSYFEEDKYLVSEDQIYLYNNKAMPGYTLVKPIESNNQFSLDKEQELVGIVKYSDGKFKTNELVGFMPRIKCEDFINGERLYRIKNNFITIKYEYQGNEKEYNPSWAKSS